MPCDRITLITLEISKADLDILMKVLKDMSLNPVTVTIGIRFYNGDYNKKTGKLRAEELIGKQIKQQYTKEVVSQQAKRFGWNVTGEGNTLSLERRATWAA